MTIHWISRSFKELDLDLFHEVLRLRTDVFVVEQRCAYAELDGQDPSALHLVGRLSDGSLVAYAGLLPPQEDGHVHIGRVVVRPDHRGQGLGRETMKRSLDLAAREYPDRKVCISAQAYLLEFYGSLGFSACSSVYDWDGIPHVDMILSGPA